MGEMGCLKVSITLLPCASLSVRQRYLGSSCAASSYLHIRLALCLCRGQLERHYLSARDFTNGQAVWADGLCTRPVQDCLLAALKHVGLLDLNPVLRAAILVSPGQRRGGTGVLRGHSGQRSLQVGDDLVSVEVTNHHDSHPLWTIPEKQDAVGVEQAFARAVLFPEGRLKRQVLDCAC